MDPTPLRRARPHLIRAAVASVVALAGMVVARFGQLFPIERENRPDNPATAPEVTLALAGAGLLLIAGVIAVRSAARAARVAMQEKSGDDRGAPIGFVISAVGYLVLALTLLSVLEVELEGLLLGGALTGVIIGIAAQQTLGNFFAGMVLIAVRPFNVGETIVLRSGPLGGEYEGRVVNMGLFYVSLVTSLGPVQLPNAGVLASAVGPGARSAKEEGNAPDEEAHKSEGGAP